MSSARNQLALFATLLAASLSTSSLFALTPIAGEDFDGGMSAVTESFSPDTSGCNGAFSTIFGSCDSSRFDRFGIMNRDTGDNLGNEGLPFDMVDETILGAVDGSGVLADDTLGILRSTKLDNVVGLADTENPQNSGPVTATWTFDISNANNLQMSIDFAALGDFDINGDYFNFTYSIDGGSSQNAFLIKPDDNGSGIDSGVVYGVEMENGMLYDRTVSPFFSMADWQALIDAGQPIEVAGEVVNTYHPGDTGTPGDSGADGIVNGTDFLELQRIAAALDDWEANYGTVDGDKVAQDGLIAARGAFALIDERAHTVTNPNGTFDEVEHDLLRDPLFVNGNAGVGTQLSNEFQTITVPIVGVGSTLTLQFEAVADGSLEYFVFDNILIEGDAVPALTAVPEPTSLLLFAMGFGLVAARSRRNR